MKKELKDYLPFYLGCQVRFNRYGDEIEQPVTLSIDLLKDALDGKVTVRPILHPLSDKEAISQIEHDEQVFLFSQYSAHPLDVSIPSFEDINRLTNAMRKAGFDCDGLIDAGLAIDATTIKAEASPLGSKGFYDQAN